MGGKPEIPSPLIPSTFRQGPSLFPTPRDISLNPGAEFAQNLVKKTPGLGIRSIFCLNENMIMTSKQKIIFLMDAESEMGGGGRHALKSKDLK